MFYVVDVVTYSTVYASYRKNVMCEIDDEICQFLKSKYSGSYFEHLDRVFDRVFNCEFCPEEKGVVFREYAVYSAFKVALNVQAQEVELPIRPYFIFFPEKVVKIRPFERTRKDGKKVVAWYEVINPSSKGFMYFEVINMEKFEELKNKVQVITLGMDKSRGAGRVKILWNTMKQCEKLLNI